MQTLIIQITDNNALKLLQSLEEMHMIKVIKKEVAPKPLKLSEKYKGFLSFEEATELNNHIDQMREEWDSN